MDAIVFKPVYMERVWGGRELERVYGRRLPQPGTPYGESWEVVDRDEVQSVVEGGRFDGMTLHGLWSGWREGVFGAGLPDAERFPLLIKILDAREDLSIQVHPPASVAGALGGEPKTEMWFIAERTPGARLYVGLRRGVDRAGFERAIAEGSVAECVHALKPEPGESIFIPSGRLHAIGAGFLIHEIQQNSDTTYRVFDWNRAGLDGRPRELHVEPSLASIDFDDVEPGMDVARGAVLADCPLFRTERLALAAGEVVDGGGDRARFSLVAAVHGRLAAADGRCFEAGRWLLLPPGCAPPLAEIATTLLRVTLPEG